jgi:hypothetical protein
MMRPQLHLELCWDLESVSNAFSVGYEKDLVRGDEYEKDLIQGDGVFLVHVEQSW